VGRGGGLKGQGHYEGGARAHIISSVLDRKEHVDVGKGKSGSRLLEEIRRGEKVGRSRIEGKGVVESLEHVNV